MRIRLSVVGISALLFALWCKSTQLQFVDRNLASNYPLIHWVGAVALMALGFLVLWLLPARLYAKRPRLFLAHSLSFLCFTLVWLGASLQLTLLLFIAAQLVCLALGGYQFVTRRYVVALGLITATQIVFHGFVSPLVWHNPVMPFPVWESGSIIPSSTLFRSDYVNAKRLDFSGFDFANWGGMSHSTTNQHSLVVPFLHILFDRATVDPTNIHLILLVLFFFLSVIGCFGFFLYLHKGLGLRYKVSLVGGVGYIFLNQAFALAHGLHFPAFSSTFLCIPYALLFFKLAIRQKNASYAALSGIAMAVPLYVAAPHINGTMYGTAFFILYALYLSIAEKKMSYFAISGLSFVASSAQYFFPLFEEVLTKEVTGWGHTDGPFLWDTLGGFYNCLSPMIISFGIFVALGIACFRDLLKRQRLRADLECFTIIGFIGAVFLIPNNKSILNWLIPALHLPLSFIYVERALAYVSLPLFILGLMGLDSISRNTRPWKVLSIWAATNFGFLALTFWYFFHVHSSIPAVELLRPWYTPHVAIQVAMVLAAAAMGVARSRRFAGVALVLLIIPLVQIAPGTGNVRSAEREDNPKACPPYFALRALAVNARGLTFDPENSRYLRSRVLSFEDDLRKYNGADRGLFAKRYEEVRGDLDRSADVIDTFYLGHSQYCYYLMPLQPEGMPRHGHFNQAGIFQNVDSPLTRIMDVTDEDYGVYGVGYGLFMHNGSTILDSRFCEGYPPLHALYILRGLDPYVAGTYSGNYSWRRNSSVVGDPTNRRIMNIAGIDVYSFKRGDFEAIKEKSDLRELEFSMAKKIKPNLVAVQDQRSRGLAYFATSVLSVAPISNLFFDLRLPFASASEPKAQAFDRLSKVAWTNLENLPEPRGVLVERNSAVGSATPAHGGEVLSSAFAGSRAAFRVSCSKTPCRFVFNMADIKGWKAYVDRTAVPIDRTNYAFIGLDIPEGNHLIWFEYCRVGSLIGAFLTLIGFAAPGLLAIRKT